MGSRRAFTCARSMTQAWQRSHSSFRTPCKVCIRAYSSPPKVHGKVSEAIKPDQLEELFATPTWSVESLLPPKDQAPDAPKISSKQLHHLLRLSALPPPQNSEQEQTMLETLAAQLHFVGEIQQVDTTGVKPLRAIQDETSQAEQEQTIDLGALQEALANEEVVGKHYKRVQRRAERLEANDVEDWDVLGSAERKTGNYFVVESERPQE